MNGKIIAATALAFCVSSAALAATSTSTTGSSANWPAAVKDTFYSDAAGTKLRTQEEVRTKWTSLSAEQKAQVKADCDKSASAAGTSTETTGSTTTATTGSTAATGDQMATMSQLCTWVKGM